MFISIIFDFTLKCKFSRNFYKFYESLRILYSDYTV